MIGLDRSARVEPAQGRGGRRSKPDDGKKKKRKKKKKKKKKGGPEIWHWEITAARSKAP